MEKNHKPYVNEKENARIRKIVDFAKEEGLSEPVDLDTFRVGYLYGLYYGGWCSVKDELPETADLVLTFDTDENYHVSWFEDGKWENFNQSYGEVVVDITHWMPLPQPPEEFEKIEEDEI